MELEEFDPDIISTTKLPITYMEDADCPKFKEFLGQILTPSDASLIQEVFGWCLLKDYRFQDAVMCVGSGANGKSTLLEVLKAFLGRDNIANIPLQYLGGGLQRPGSLGSLRIYIQICHLGGSKKQVFLKCSQAEIK
jgi:Predicted ATPase